MPGSPRAARADAPPTGRWVTITGATYTSAVLLGAAATAAPPAPVASSSPSRGTVIGAVVGSILAFFCLLFLVWAWVRLSRADWIPPRRGPVDEVYIANPNVAPVRLAVGTEQTGITATRVVIERTEAFERFLLSRPARKRERERERERERDRPPVVYSSESSESSMSSLSSDHS